GRVGRGRLLLRRRRRLRRPPPVAAAPPPAPGRRREGIVQGGGGGGPGARVPVRALQVGLGPCAPSVALGPVLQLLPRRALALRLLLAALRRRRLTPRLLRGTIPLLRLRFLQLGWSRGAQAAGGGGGDLSSHDPPPPHPATPPDRSPRAAPCLAGRPGPSGGGAGLGELRLCSAERAQSDTRLSAAILPSAAAACQTRSGAQPGPERSLPPVTKEERAGPGRRRRGAAARKTRGGSAEPGAGGQRFPRRG
ncbi:hypothetical protein Nmel_017671, partial [Mimus melanotis]